MKVTDDRIVAWLEGDLSGEEATTVAAAVLGDPSMAARHERLKAARDLLLDAGTVPAPPGFAARVQAAIDAVEATDVAPRRSSRAVVVAILACAAVALIVILVASSTPTPAAPDLADAPTATFQATPVRAILVPDGLRVVTPLPAEAVRSAVETVGARWTEGEGGVTLTLEASAVRGLEQRLGSLGTLRAVGETAPRTGTVTLRLEIAAE